MALVVERLRAHISYLASDKLEGRRTGSAGANMAAEYVAREFSRYGLRRSIGRDLPGMSILEADSPRRYMQEFPFVAGVELGKNNSMTFTSLDLRIGEDWMPLGLSASARVENAPVVFVGYGITAANQNYDDYSVFRKSGGVAVALSGTPDGENPHGKFAGAGEPRFKAAASRAAGARALVLIASEDNFKDDKLTILRYNNEGGDAGLPVVVVSRQAGAKIIGLTGAASFAQVEKDLVAEATSPAGNNAFKSIDILRLPTTGKPLSITTDIVRREAPAYNVAGILEGSDPVLKNEVIVIGAHYDHLGRGGEGSLAPREGDIHHGADDNASGVAGVLELARFFRAQKMKRSLVFIAFSGEE
ncbi:MAG TPA: M28 family peptidase, partial [Pyrinomonadaceae bacterium]|nr:M28 family peptidase [Pyrinomonadaceae bacterium]